MGSQLEGSMPPEIVRLLSPIAGYSQGLQFPLQVDLLGQPSFAAKGILGRLPQAQVGMVRGPKRLWYGGQVES